jgi:hypothetical protein
MLDAEAKVIALPDRRTAAQPTPVDAPSATPPPPRAAVRSETTTDRDIS